eukprot:CAMPEP_0171326228 /NCGR_PEP_ID=MMETSP0816-20121228/117317_1 /TAXON_ID=420281 /ORGANISM="Proboscia inermis, Strain CCAP1064/1" /LENGTH=173 /DNA_ID=CAMNT_0011825633 /DNA_START=924 /DNA_END=1445 /DNA_ORIENTATION=-
MHSKYYTRRGTGAHHTILRVIQRESGFIRRQGAQSFFVDLCEWTGRWCLTVDQTVRIGTAWIPHEGQFQRDALCMRANFKLWGPYDETNHESNSTPTNRTNDESSNFNVTPTKKKDNVEYVMFERGDNRTLVQVRHYPMVSDQIQSLMNPLRNAFQSTLELPQKSTTCNSSPP